MQTHNSNSLNVARSTRPRSRRSLVATIIAVPALVALTACSGAAPTPPSQPTVQAAATQIVAAASPAAATVQAAASPAMATAQAGASPAIATMQAGAAPAAATGAAIVGTAVSGLAPMASPSPSPSPSPAAQGAGALRISDASLSDSTPWLSIQNSSDEVIPMAGWKLQIGQATAELPADAVVQPGSALTLHAGNGLSSEDELFLGNAGDALAAAAMPGTPVILTDAEGTIHAQTTVPRF